MNHARHASGQQPRQPGLQTLGIKPQQRFVELADAIVFTWGAAKGE